MNKTISFIKKFLPFFLVIFCCLILSSGKYSFAVTDGIKLWAAYLLPSFFPYIFLTTILSELDATNSLIFFLDKPSKKLFKLNGGALYAFFMSIISGYPMGAKVVSDLVENKTLSISDGKRAAILASTSSPAFTIGVVGSVIFNDILFGILLFIINITCTIITAILFSINRSPENLFPVSIKNEKSSFYDLTYSSVISILIVGGIIALFSLLIEILSSLDILSPIKNLFTLIFNSEVKGEGITFGLLEFTRGIKTLSGEKIDLFTLPITAFICSFGGLSVIAQSLCYLKKVKIKTALFILSKIVCAVLSFILGLLLSILFL